RERLLELDHELRRNGETRGDRQVGYRALYVRRHAGRGVFRDQARIAEDLRPQGAHRHPARLKSCAHFRILKRGDDMDSTGMRMVLLASRVLRTHAKKLE